MESRIRVLLLIACAIALSGCSMWPFHKKHALEPVPVDATTADGSAPAVVEPTVVRRKVKTPSIKNSNFELGPYVGTYSGIPPEGVLRCAVFANHTTAQIDRLLDELRTIL